MKIGKPADKSPIPLANNGASGTAAAAPAPAPAASGTANAIPSTADPSAKIELSHAASALMSGSVQPEFDAQKVAKVSQAIDAGQYKINPGVIADKLISNAKELLSQSQP
jgi:negative regulator of flagellin synthesis FlgM